MAKRESRAIYTTHLLSFKHVDLEIIFSIIICNGKAVFFQKLSQTNFGIQPIFPSQLLPRPGAFA